MGTHLNIWRLGYIGTLSNDGGESEVEPVGKFWDETKTGDEASVGDSVGEFTGEQVLALKSRGCSSPKSVSGSSFLTDDSALRLGGRNQCGTTSVGRRKFPIVL